MFKQILFKGNTPDYIEYNIIDSQFEKTIFTKRDDSVIDCRLAAIFEAYYLNKMPIAKNIALFYFSHVYYDNLETGKYYLDNYFPHFQYGTKYYPCVLNHLRKLDKRYV